jgi:hypothetical protein
VPDCIPNCNKKSCEIRAEKQKDIIELASSSPQSEVFRNCGRYGLGNSRSELRAIREKLAKNRFAEPLFDTPRFGRNLEKAYKEMWKIFLAGEQPRRIEVKEY